MILLLNRVENIENGRQFKRWKRSKLYLFKLQSNAAKEYIRQINHDETRMEPYIFI